MTADPLLTVEQVAARLSLSVGHTYRIVERGDIEKVLLGRRAVRVAESALARYIAERTHGARKTRAVA